MTTITKILAEAFNRVKSEHGVTLSRVEFNGTDIEFNASGIVRTVHPVPAPNAPPEGATHYGSLDGGNPRYYNYRNGVLLGWGGWVGWCKYVSLSDATYAELVDQLTPLKQSASGSDS